MDGRANLRKLSINVVTPNKPKLLVGLDQKVERLAWMLCTHPTRIRKPPADRESLTHPVKQGEQGKPESLPEQGVGLLQGRTMAVRVEDTRKSECRSVTEGIPIAISSGAKAS